MPEETITVPTGAGRVATVTEERGARSNERIDFGAFLLIAAQLGLILGVALVFRIELDRGFGVVALLTFLGFTVHSWLPLRFRLPFFLFLTMTAIGILLGIDGLWLVALGLGLLGLCHLPVSWGIRVGLVVVAAVGLALSQLGWVEGPWTEAVIPVLGAMFMFRIILYLYDLKNDRTPAGFWQRLGYFFLLPNVCFPLFPVVDFKSFLHTYYDVPAREIYQKGTYWMLRGVGHLLLYRIIYYLLPRADSEFSVVGVYVYMAMTYGLYLRISGLFHLIVGSLCVFGFNLPRTNNHYFLASSFTDFWRRINTYWNDFMMTVVFYPVFMSVRGWSMTRRLVFATMCVFLVSWLLHSYQWFWLQGQFPIAQADIAFWGLLGGAAAINGIGEARHGKRRSRKSGWSAREALGVTARTIGVFSAIAIIWSLWSSGSLLEWGYRLLRVRDSSPVDWVIFLALIGMALAVGVTAHWLDHRGWGMYRLEGLAWQRAPVLVPVAALSAMMVGLPAFYESLGGPVERVVSKVRSTQLNEIDANRQERGYYETLSRATQFGSGLNVVEFDEDFAGFRDSPAVRRTGDIRGYEMVPETEISFRGSVLRANRWGMHDRDYDMTKPPEVRRIALLGSSYVMGWGVSREQTFENIVEDRLNGELSDNGNRKFEILNFSVGGYNILQCLYVARQSVVPFDPDVILYVVHPNESRRLVERLQLMLKLGVEFDATYLPVKRAIDETGAHAYLPANEFSRRLEPYRADILQWAYRSMVEAAREQGAVVGFLFLPMTTRNFEEPELLRLSRMAREAGGLILYPEGLFEGYDLESIQLAAGDSHPSVLGHQLIADAVYKVLLENAGSLALLPQDMAHTALEARP